MKELVPGSDAAFELALLDPGFSICDFHVFDRTGPASIAGLTFVRFTDAQGNCDSSSRRTGYERDGTRLSTAAELPARRARLEAVRQAREAALDAERAAAAGEDPVRDLFARALEALQR